MRRSEWGAYEERGRRQERVFRRWFLGLMLFACLLLVAIAKVSPESDTYSSNLDDAPVTTRTLVPRETTTTAHTLTSGPQRTSTTVARQTPDEITVIFGGQVVRIHRNSATQPLFTKLEEMTR